MAQEDIYKRLSRHLSKLAMGYPPTDDLVEILRENYTPLEAEVATEVCLKFDEIARYVIDRNLGRKISRQEALEIIRQSEQAGLVHFVDNAAGQVKHNCNCCGCACWNVGSIRRRKIPRDVIMATYFIRETDEEQCTGCGECVDVCPVDAISMDGDFPKVDQDWCIGCGVCAASCPTGAVKIRLRPDRSPELPGGDFETLHETILAEKGLKGQLEGKNLEIE